MHRVPAPPRPDPRGTAVPRHRSGTRALLVALGSSAVLLVAAACGSAATPSPGAGSAATATMSMSTMAASPMAMGTATAMAMGSPAAGAQVTQTQTVGSFNLTLMVGPQEQMYTQDQAGQQHPTSGEVMVSGSMTMPGATPMAAMGAATTPASGMSMPTGDQNTRHLEVHVADATSGQTIMNATVTIQVIDNTANGMATDVPIATMYGVTAGTTDFHYGNNVEMPVNRDYTVKVTVNGQAVTFTFHLGG